MIIYLDGAEKAGKTSLIRMLRTEFLESKSAIVIKQTGKANPDGFVYLQELIQSVASKYIFIWDRGWISEVVYGKLLFRLDENFGTRLFSEDKWLAEWFLSRLTVGRGGTFVISPNNPKQLIERRDDSDLPVYYKLEDEYFRFYAENYGHTILVNDYTEESARENCRRALRKVYLDSHPFLPWEYIGPKSPKFVMVNQTLSTFDLEDYNLQVEYPFYDKFWMEVFRPFGRKAISEFGYSTPYIVPKLGNKTHFIAFGEKAHDYIKVYTDRVSLVRIPRTTNPAHEDFVQQDIANQILDIISGG